MQGILVHEFGHCFGLEHSISSNDTMIIITIVVGSALSIEISTGCAMFTPILTTTDYVS